MSAPVTVTGKLVDSSGNGVSGNVSFILSWDCWLSDSTAELIQSKRIDVATAADGTYSVLLYPNADLLPAGSSYTVTESYLGEKDAQYSIVVPHGGGNVAALITASPPVAAQYLAVVTPLTAADGTIIVGGTIDAQTVRVGTVAEAQVSGLPADLADLDADIGEETTRATAAEATLTTNLATETTRATAAEGTLTTNVAEIETDLGEITASVTTETTRATAAETANTTAITAEATTARAAEALLAPKASPTFTGTVTVPASGAGTTAAQKADVTAEAATARAAESANASAITTETSRATTAEGLLAPKASPTFTGTVTVPASSGATDAAQKADVTAEATARATAVSAEATARANADALLAPIASPTFTGTVTVPAQVNATDPARKSYVDAETTRATAAEGLAAQKSANLSDLANAGTARTNLAVPPSSRQIASGTGLSGGGDLTADRTLAVSYGTTAGTAAQGNDSRITGAAVDSTVVHNTGAETVAGVKTFSSAPVVPAASFPESAITGLTTDLTARELTANKGAASGYAPLDGTSRVPDANLPADIPFTDQANTFTQPQTATIYEQALGRSVAQYGVLPSNPDNAAAWATAEAAAIAGSFDLEVPAGTYNFTSGGITWAPDSHAVRARGEVSLNFNALAAGYCITVQPHGTSGSFNSRPNIHPFAGFEILAPDADATVVDIFSFTGGAGNAAGTAVEHCKVYGGRHQLTVGTNAYLLRFINSAFGHAHGNIFNAPAGSTNAGENIFFSGCTLYNSSNPTGGYSACAVYVDPAADNFDLNFVGCSFDYNDLEFNVGQGIVTLLGCHIEDRGNNGNPMGKFSYTGAGVTTGLTMIGGQIAPTDSSPTNRSWLFEAVSGSNLHFTFAGVKWGAFGLPHDLVYADVASVNPTVHWTGGFIDVQAGVTTPRISTLANKLSNGQFSATAIGTSPTSGSGGWRGQGLGGGTVLIVAGAVLAQAAQFVGVGIVTSSFVMYQTLPCVPGGTYLVTAQVAITGYTAGTLTLQARYYDNNGAQLSSTNPAALTANQALARIGGKFQVPAGTTSMLIGFQQSGSFAGTVNIEDVCLNTLEPTSGTVPYAQPANGSITVAGNEDFTFPTIAVNYGTAATTATQGNDVRVVTNAAAGHPTVNSDSSAGYGIGSRWVNTGTNELYTCTNASVGAAVWQRLTADVQVFLAGGTWNKPAWAQTVNVRAIGPGGGGGAGARTSVATAGCGGGGAGGGGFSWGTFAASTIGSSETVSVGTGGTGATGQTSDSSAGANGGAASGGNSFGAHLQAGRGAAGNGGGLGVAAGSTGASSGNISGPGGVASSASGAGGSNGSGSGGTGSGGSGGGLTITAQATSAGGAGGAANGAAATSATAGTLGGGTGGNGSAATANEAVCGGGGAGGGSNATGAGGAGGNGGRYGGGGGGGGASANTFTSGAGGNGGDGIVVVITT